MCEKNVISISGGKDSTALALLAIEQEVENLHFVFADTGNEHQSTYDYIDYLAQTLKIKIKIIKADFTEKIIIKRNNLRVKWQKKGVPQEIIDRVEKLLVPSGNPFLDSCIYHGIFPSKKRRFCTESLKLTPFSEQIINPYLEQGYDVTVLVGERADESHSRALKPTKEWIFTNQKTGAEHWISRPIKDWTIDDVFKQHKKHNIKPNPLYLQGMSRVGCMPCINCNKEELNQISKRFPEELERIKRWEKLVSLVNKQSKATFFTANYRGSRIEDVIEWSYTARGGKQLDIFKSSKFTPKCYSKYGLCE